MGKTPKLVPLAQTIDLDERISLVLTPPTFGSECYLQPACPNDYSAHRRRRRASAPPWRNVFKARPRASPSSDRPLLDEGAIVHVLNGTRPRNTRTTRVADALAELGLDAVVPPIAGGAADRDDYPKAVIVAWNGAQKAMPLAARVLADALGVKHPGA